MASGLNRDTAIARARSAPSTSRTGRIQKLYGTPDDERPVSKPWPSMLIDRLLNTVRPGGAWGYRTAQLPSAEPTAIACLALSGHAVDASEWRHALDWLANEQRSDGGVPASAAAPLPCWPTGLAVVAWNASAPDKPGTFAPQIQMAAEWLLTVRGRKVAHRPDVFGHNTRLQGWSWVEGTHSWLEPTAYAVMGLRAAGLSDHARTREGVALLWDRMFDGGGWNYGNTRVLGKPLRPFPAPSGIVLTALSGELTEASIDPSLAYLRSTLQRVRSPMSLGWGLIGLSAWNARPAQADAWLAESARVSLAREAHPLEDALLLLASAPSHALAPARPSVEATHNE